MIKAGRGRVSGPLPLSTDGSPEQREKRKARREQGGKPVRRLSGHGFPPQAGRAQEEYRSAVLPTIGRTVRVFPLVPRAPELTPLSPA